jgi:hypothetical protein
MAPATPLRDATVQDIQLELIRRSGFNDFDGEQVCALLARHRALWAAVLFDRPGVPNYREPTRLLAGGLIKLRDLPDNIWNVDTLFVLTPTKAARELAAVSTKGRRRRTRRWALAGGVRPADGVVGLTAAPVE